MSAVDHAVNRFHGGCNCAQAIVATYGPGQGLDEPTGLKVACGFGGGMRCGETCGAVTGALMVLGLRFGPGRPAQREARHETYRQVNDFLRLFELQCGALKCRDLLGCDVGTPEGLQYARANNLFATQCPQYVRRAAELLEKALGPAAVSS